MAWTSGAGLARATEAASRKIRRFSRMELTFASLMIKTCARRRDLEKLRSRPVKPILDSRSRMARRPPHQCVNFWPFSNSEEPWGSPRLHLLEIRIDYRDGLVDFDYKAPRH